MDNPLVIIAAALLAVALLVGGWVIAVYNRFAAVRQHVRESWAGIDVELKRRYDLIPNLVETVKGYARHERETLERIVELRNRAMAHHATAADLAVDESALLAGMKRLFAVAEAYPELKADARFLALQRELANTEDRIAASRRLYNGNVREMNLLRHAFPTNVRASLFGYQGATFFEIQNDLERIVPRINI